MSPMLRFNLIFWTVSAPMTLYVLFLVLIGLGAWVFPNRYTLLIRDAIELHVSRICQWRNDIGIVKRARDRAYLFDYIKEFE